MTKTITLDYAPKVGTVINVRSTRYIVRAVRKYHLYSVDVEEIRDHLRKIQAPGEIFNVR